MEVLHRGRRGGVVRRIRIDGLRHVVFLLLSPDSFQPWSRLFHGQLSPNHPQIITSWRPQSRLGSNMALIPCEASLPGPTTVWTLLVVALTSFEFVDFDSSDIEFSLPSLTLSRHPHETARNSLVAKDLGARTFYSVPTYLGRYLGRE